MMKLLIISFAVLILVVLIYAIVPTIFIRLYGRGITKRLHADGIAITFDDGPNPEYTPQLLDLLKEYNVKATFFVVGSKVIKYPDIIKRMSEEGHTIGIHHFEHVSSWILSPFQLKRQLLMTEQAIKECTNKEVRFYRPPWGNFNLFSLLISKRYQVIMWSHIFGDWKIKEDLYKELHSATEAGSILLLHDCGETWGAEKLAPCYMLKNLEIYLKENRENGTNFVTLNEMYPMRTS